MAKYNTFLVVQSKSGRVMLVTSSARKAQSELQTGRRVEVWSENQKVETITTQKGTLLKYIKLEKEYIRNKQRAAEERRWVNGKTKERNRPRAV